MTFTTLIEGFKGFFSRSFWFGSFLPVALIAAAHGAMASLVLRLDSAAFIKQTIGASPGNAVLLFVGLVVLGYALGPITPLFNGLLGGVLLPGWLHDRLRRERARLWRIQAGDLRKAQDDYAAAVDPSFMGRLQAADAAPKPARSAAGDEVIRAAIVEVEASIAGLIRDAAGDWIRNPDKLDPTVVTLATALAGNIAELDAAEPAGKWLDRADKAWTTISRLHREATNESRHRLESIGRRMPNLNLQDLQATRLGDARYTRERYVRDTYGVSFGFLWPRIRMVIADGEQDDGKGLPRSVADTGAMVDFAVLLLVLSLTIPAFWLPLIALWGKSVWIFLALGLLTPFAIKALYELLIRSEMAFGDIVETAIDRHRLAVFPMLAMPLPATLSAERDLWSRLEKASWSGGNVELVYKHAQAAS